jgi:nitrilase
MNNIAAIQMASGPNIGANLSQVEQLVQQAVEQQAKLILLPENFACIPNQDKELLDIAESEGKGMIQGFLSKLAKQHNVWIVAGSIPLHSDKAGKIKQALLVFNNRGEQVARYNKIHLFDVLIEESGESYNESSIMDADEKSVVIDTPFGKIGLSICYDLRFPELYRELQEKGAQIFLIPSAFTKITGFAHWEPLIKARAIENLAYVIAAAQGGYHLNGRETYGHSMIVDPWGRIVAQQNQGTGVIVAPIDIAHVRQTRKNFPTLNHRKLK